MKNVIRIFGILAVLLAAGFAYAEEAGAPPADQIEKWVKQLGDSSFAVRSEAESNLARTGESARKPLETAAESDDAEVKLRASRLLGAIKTAPVLKKMAEALQNAKGFEADVKMDMKMMGQQASTLAHIVSTADGSRLKLDGTMMVMGQSMKMASVCDGTTFWNEMNMPNGMGLIVQKMSRETMKKMGSSQNPLESIKQLTELYTFTDVTDGKLPDGADAIILTGAIKADAIEEKAKAASEAGGAMAGQMVKTQLGSIKTSKIYIDKSTYLARKTESLDTKGDVVMNMEVSNTKLSAPSDESIFNYTPPKDAKVMDMDQMMKGARNAGNAPAGAGAGAGVGN